MKKNKNTFDCTMENASRILQYFDREVNFYRKFSRNGYWILMQKTTYTREIYFKKRKLKDTFHDKLRGKKYFFYKTTQVASEVNK